MLNGVRVNRGGGGRFVLSRANTSGGLPNGTTTTPTRVSTVPIQLPPTPTVNRLERIGSTNFNVEFVIRQLSGRDENWDRLMTGGGRRLRQVTVTQISGIGFLSYIYRIKFHFDDGGGVGCVDGCGGGGVEKTFTVILKVPTVIHIPTVNHLADDAFLKDFAVKLAERHNKEVYFYEHFAPHLRHFHLAKIYSTRDCHSSTDLEHACILMEDLGPHGVGPSVVGGMNKAQVESVIRAVAEMHALSLALPDSAALMEKLCWTHPLDREDGQAKNAAVSILLTLPHDYFRRHQKAIEKCASLHEIMKFDAHKHFGTPPVLCHGDLWANNIFFHPKPDGTIGDELYAIFDWQFAHPNSGLIDIVRMILVCVNATVKLRYMNDWIRLYFECFSEGCHRHNIHCPYTLELVERMFYYQYPSEVLFSFIILLNHYARLEDEGLKTSLLGRMVSSFEVIRKRYQ